MAVVRVASSRSHPGTAPTRPTRSRAGERAFCLFTSPSRPDSPHPNARSLDCDPQLQAPVLTSVAILRRFADPSYSASLAILVLFIWALVTIFLFFTNHLPGSRQSHSFAHTPPCHDLLPQRCARCCAVHCIPGRLASCGCHHGLAVSLVKHQHEDLAHYSDRIAGLSDNTLSHDYLYYIATYHQPGLQYRNCGSTRSRKLYQDV